jgi:hypothetical protein
MDSQDLTANKCGSCGFQTLDDLKIALNVVIEIGSKKNFQEMLKFIHLQ